VRFDVPMNVPRLLKSANAQAQKESGQMGISAPDLARIGFVKWGVKSGRAPSYFLRW
jgi:hypothetical protein